MSEREKDKTEEEALAADLRLIVSAMVMNLGLDAVDEEEALKK